MSTFQTYELSCSCGEPFTVQLAESVNVERAPELRDEILAGRFHTVSCPACGKTMTVEKPFFYIDPASNALFRVMPRGDRHLWRQASAQVEEAHLAMPDFNGSGPSRQLRAVFGLAELREKLVAQDAKIDDRIVELIKVVAISDHPFLVQRPRLRLELHSTTPDTMTFRAGFDHNPAAFMIDLGKDVYPGLVAKQDELKTWSDEAHGDKSLFKDQSNRWVNLWRFSPQPGALDQLHAYAQDIAAHKPIDTNGSAFQAMMAGLPSGAQLPPQGKQDLAVLFGYARAQNNGPLQQAIFKKRYHFDLVGDWATNNDPDDISSLYALLRTLPPTNVEGNSAIRDITLDGTNGGLYSPKQQEIHIGEGTIGDKWGFLRTVRHEVGHAVEEHFHPKITDWVASRFGWQMLDGSSGAADANANIDRWVSMLGGWGAATPQQITEMRGWIQAALGPGSVWVPGSVPNVPAGHIWLSPNYAPRIAFESTGSATTPWYQNYAHWHRYGGKAFFLNFWYQTLCIVDETTLHLVDEMPWNYAAMSPAEFFAELYAAYYNTDTDRKIDYFPTDVVPWFDQNVGALQPTGAPAIVAPSPPAERAPWTLKDRPRRVSSAPTPPSPSKNNKK